MRENERPSWDCACTGDHYETNASRAWCGDCTEWCYPGDVDMLCIRGLEPLLRAEVGQLREVADAARLVLDASIFPAKYPHVGTLRDAVARLDASSKSEAGG